MAYTVNSSTLHIIRNAWAADGSHYALVGADKLYKSTNGAVTHSLLYTFPDSPGRMYGLYIDSRGYIFVGTLDEASGKNGRCYRSTDSGANFSLISTFGGATVSFWSMVEDTDGYLYCGNYMGDNDSASVWKSTDAGTNWTNISSEAMMAGRHIHGLHIDPTNGWLYANIGDSTDALGMWRSKLKDGSDWVKKSALKAIGITSHSGYIYTGDDAMLGSIQRFQDDGGADIATPVKVLESGTRCNIYWLVKDQTGRFWTSSPASDAVYGACTGYLFTSTDGVTWETVTSTPGIDYSSWYNASNPSASYWTFHTGTTQWLDGAKRTKTILPLGTGSIYVEGGKILLKKAS